MITGLESRLRDDDKRIATLQSTLRKKEDVITSAKGHIDALALEAERTAELRTGIIGQVAYCYVNIFLDRMWTTTVLVGTKPSRS
jgi:hypothetical protein